MTDPPASSDEPGSRRAEIQVTLPMAMAQELIENGEASLARTTRGPGWETISLTIDGLEAIGTVITLTNGVAGLPRLFAVVRRRRRDRSGSRNTEPEGGERVTAVDHLGRLIADASIDDPEVLDRLGRELGR